MKNRARNLKDIMTMTRHLIPFENDFRSAFNQPEDRGTWLIWGQSGSGKSSFAMQLVKELAQHYGVLYNSLEEEFGQTFVNKVELYHLDEVADNVKFVSESMDELLERLRTRRSPKVVVIDSLQYTGINFKFYKKIKKHLPSKLLIFISHAEGKQPAGRVGKQVAYDASMKIYCEGYRAISKGREIGPNGGIFTIWEEGAERVWGDSNNQENQEL